jgi:hypothetical protein
MPANSSIQRDRRGGINYPSPYFDISSTYVPPSMKEFFKWTRFFYYSHSVIHPIIDKISEYPITGLIYQVDGEEDKLPEKTKKNWKKLMEATLRIKSFQVEMFLDYNVYGNALASIVYPFKRYLKCRECDHRMAIDKVRYKWKDFKFRGTCEKCNHQGVFDVSDADIKNRSMCRLMRWNPFFVSIEHNPVTDERDYWYRIPNKDRKAIIQGKKMWIERTPWVFVEAVRDNKQIKLDNKNLYHMRRPTIADADMAWGMPLILPVIKDAYWLQILRKANEAIALDHVVPWRILFPAANADISPYVQQNLSSWRQRVEDEVKKWRQDPNHISIMPLPIGTQNFGGDAKLLQVWQEEKVIQQQIAGGIGVPLELVFGGLSWSGSSVSLRILENHFIRDREEMDNFLNEFLVPNLQRYFRLPKITVKQKNFKMADDVQQKQLIMQLMQMGKVSDSTVLEENNLSFQDEATKRMQEQNTSIEFQRQQMLQQAEIQGAISVVTARYQGMAQAESMKVQQAMAPPMPMQPQQPMQQQGQQPGGPPQPMSQPGGQQTQKPPVNQPGAQQPTQPQQPLQQQQQGAPIQMAQGGVVTGPGTNGGHVQQKSYGELAKTMMTGLQRMDTDAREILLKEMEGHNMMLATMIRKQLASSKKAAIDMRPLPEQKPPNRKVGPV